MCVWCVRVCAHVCPVCACVCMCVQCVRVCVYVCPVCACVCMCVRVWVGECDYVMHVCTDQARNFYACSHKTAKHQIITVFVSVHAEMFTSVCVCVCVCVYYYYVCVCACYYYVCVCVYVCIIIMCVRV